METVVDPWRYSDCVAITQQDTTIALADERAVPISTIPRHVFRVYKGRRAIRLVSIKDDGVYSEMLVGNNRIVNNMLAGNHQLDLGPTAFQKPPSVRVPANDELLIGIDILN